MLSSDDPFDAFEALPVARSLKRTYSRRHQSIQDLGTGLATPPASSSPPASPSMRATIQVQSTPARITPLTPTRTRPRSDSTSRSITALLQRSHNPITKKPKPQFKVMSKDKKQGKELVQMHLNLLPAHVTCKQCGMSYTRTSPSDLALHSSFHSSHLLGLQLSSTLHLSSGIHRLTCTKQSDRNMIQKCCELVDLELSASLSPLANQFSAYIDVHQNRIRSFVVVHPISKAQKLLDGGDLSTIEEKVAMGVNRMWTSRNVRGKGIVARLLDHAITVFVNGCRLEKSEVAFTQLSESGHRAVENWNPGNPILIYSD